MVISSQFYNSVCFSPADKHNQGYCSALVSNAGWARQRAFSLTCTSSVSLWALSVHQEHQRLDMQKLDSKWQKSLWINTWLHEGELLKHLKYFTFISEEQLIRCHFFFCRCLSVSPNSGTCPSPAWRPTPSRSFSMPPASCSCRAGPITTSYLWASSFGRGTPTGSSSSVTWTMARWRSHWKTAKLWCTSMWRPATTGQTCCRVSHCKSDHLLD